MTDNTPIKSKDIKVGQVVEGTQVVDGAQWTVRMKVGKRAHGYLWSTKGGPAAMKGFTWTLIEDVPNPDAELIEAIVWALQTTLTTNEEEDARAALAAIRETHNIVPKEKGTTTQTGYDTLDTQ